MLRFVVMLLLIQALVGLKQQHFAQRSSIMRAVATSNPNQYVGYRSGNVPKAELGTIVPTTDMTRTEVEALVQMLLVQDNVREQLHSGTSVLSYEVHERNMDAAKWNDLLAATMKWNLMDYAIKVFTKMIKKDVKLSYPVVTSLISMLGERRLFEEGLFVLDKAVEKKMTVSVQHYLPLLKSCGNIANARRILLRMESAGLDTSVISYTAAIKSCEETADWRSALQLLALLPVVGLQPNEVTYSCAISVAAKAGRADIALNLLREMNSYRRTVPESNPEPNQVCYGSVMTVCARVGMWSHVDGLLQELVDQGAVLQESVLVSVIMTLKRTPASLINTRPAQLLQSSTGGLPPVDVKSGAHMEPCERVLHLLDKWGDRVSQPTDVLHTIVMEVLESHGHSADVLQLYRKCWHVSAPPPTRRILNVVMRACVAELDADASLMMLWDMQRADLDFAAAYNASIYICDQRGRHAEAVKLLRYVSGTKSTASDSNTIAGDSMSGTASSVVAAQYNSKMPPKWLIRRVISRGLVALARSAASIQHTPTSLPTPSAALTAQLPFAADLARVLSFAVKNYNMHPESTCYALSSKLLLEIGAVPEVRWLLNQTLYLPAVESARLYEQAARSILQSSPLHSAIGTLRLFIQDGAAAGQHANVANLLYLSLSRIGAAVLEVTASEKAKPNTTAGRINPLLLTQHNAGAFDPKLVNPELTACAALMQDIFSFAAPLLRAEPVSVKAYLVAVCVYKSANMPEHILSSYRAACVQHPDLHTDTHFNSVVMNALSQFPQYTTAALELYKNATTPSDLYRFRCALWACVVGGHWEESLRILDRVQQSDYPVDIKLVNAALRACSNAGRVEEVRQLLCVMDQQHIEKDEETYHQAILCCAKHRQWEECLHLTADLSCLSSQASGVLAADRVGNSAASSNKVATTVGDVVDALCSEGQSALAAEVYKIALQQGVVKPFHSIQRGLVDLQGHSVHMSKIAVTLALNTARFCAKQNSTADPGVGNASVDESTVAPIMVQFAKFAHELTHTRKGSEAPDMVLLFDKGGDLMTQIQKHIKSSFSPSIRCSVSTALKRITLRGSDVVAQTVDDTVRGKFVQ